MSSGARLGVGKGTNMDNCEDQVLETIGKAFPPEAGYGKWTKDSSMKYILANGMRVDFKDANGQRAKVTLVDGQQLVGRLKLGGWFIQLTTTGDNPETFEINPAGVKAITPASKWKV